MNKKLVSFVILMSLGLVGCDKVVSQQPVGQPFIQHKRQSCTYVGYCYECGLDFNRDVSCGFHFSYHCGGAQNTTVKVTPVQIKYESGTIENTQTVETVSIDSECE